jgi:hypothetical protein
MKKVSILAVLFLVFAVAQVWAAPVPACQSGVSLTTYLGAGFSCTIGDKTFSNFAYTDSAFGGALAVPSDGVTVSTMGPSGEAVLSTDIGLQFSAGWNAPALGTTDSDISFVVSVTGGGPLMIKDAGLAQVSSVTANGSASVSEDACTPGFVTPGVPCNPSTGTITVLTFDSGGTNILRSANTLFAPTGSISVSKDISVTGGTTGQAHLSVVQDTFSQTAVPEPASMMLVGGALFGVGLIRRRSKKA